MNWSNPGWDRMTKPERPNGFIQWKTHVCVDLWCPCGAHGHLNDDFTYFWRCLECGASYALNPHIELVPLTPAEISEVEGTAVGFKTDDEHEQAKQLAEVLREDDA